LTIFRGAGGGGNATTDSQLNVLTTLASAASVSADVANSAAAAASSSATASSNSASSAASSQSSAATAASSSATASSNSASSAALATSKATEASNSATAAAASAASVNAANLVNKTGNETIAGIKTFTDNVVAPIINGVAPLHLNDIVNGDFRVAQAGTSFAAAVNSAYDLDGWLNINGSTAVFTVAQAAGSSSGRLARQVTITTVDAAVAAADFVADQANIEGSNIEKYVGNTFTVAFRARVPVVGIHCVSLRNTGADRSYIREINFPVANVYQDCSFTVVGGLTTAGTWNYTTGLGLRINFTHMAGTTYQTATTDSWVVGNFLGTANQVNDCATVGNVWALEKVTMNLGTVAAVSEISIEQDFQKCQRYYQFIEASSRFTAAGATQTFNCSINFTIMRAIPTAVFVSEGSRSNLSSATLTSVSRIGARHEITSTAAGDAFALVQSYALSARI
jgi:hypothetical protein